MTKEEAIIVIESHRAHWQRLLKEKICDETEGKETIESFELAISALSAEPCEDCISREKLLKQQYRIDDSATLSTRDVVNVEDIEDAPSVQSIRPKGEWIDDSPVTWKCSCCDYQVHRWNNTNFCPNCGAVMKEE